MEIRLTKDVLLTVLTNSWNDNGLLVLNVPDDSCKKRLTVSACHARFGESSAELTPTEAAILLEVLDGPRDMQDVLDATFIDEDKTLHNHISSISSKLRKQRLPFRVSWRGARVQILENTQKI
jgi:hypothetical protein